MSSAVTVPSLRRRRRWGCDALMPSRLGWMLVALVLVLTACVRQNDGGPTDTFRFALGSDPETFDPGRMSGSVEGKVAYQLYEGLLTPAADGSPVAGVAERWEVSPDNLTWTFHLRSNAKWSNGDPLTAHDFVYAWKRQLRGDIPSDYVTFLRYIRHVRAQELLRPMLGFLGSRRLDARMLDAIGLEVVNDQTLVIRLQQPTPYFADVAMFYTLFPVHRGSIEQFGQDDAFRAANLVTNGPYRMVEFRRRNRIVLEANPHWHAADSLAMRHVHALIIEDGSARVTAFQDGRVDWIDDLPHNQLPVLATDPGFHGGPMLGTYYYRFNVTRPPFDDVRVRRALTLALNRSELCRCTLGAEYRPANSFVPPIPGYDAREILPFDPDEARRLLAEAGYGPDNPLPRVTLLYNTSENHRVIAQAVQDMWAVELGVEVELLNQEWKVYLEAMEALDFQIARAGWIGDYADANTFLSLWRSFDENNNTGWENREYDALMGRSMAEPDPARRRQILMQAEDLLLTELPVVPLYWYSQFHLVHPVVSGWEMNVRDTHLIRWIRKTPVAGGGSQ